jgi:hypothetical protein
VKYFVLGLIYLYVIFMAWSAFGWVGIAYVIIVPIPFILFSYIVRRRKQTDNANPNKPLSLWSSPVPYFAAIFVVIILLSLTS